MATPSLKSTPLSPKYCLAYTQQYTTLKSRFNTFAYTNPESPNPSWLRKYVARTKMIEKTIIHRLWFLNSSGVDVEAKKASKTPLNAIIGM